MHIAASLVIGTTKRYPNNLMKQVAAPNNNGPTLLTRFTRLR